MTREIYKVLEVEGGRVFGMLVRMTLRVEVAEELLQELFVRMGSGAGMAGLGKAENKGAYVRRAAIHLALDWRRQRGSERVVGVVGEGVEERGEPGWLQVERREEVERVMRVVAEMSAVYREVFVLRYVEEWGFEEIGRAVGRTGHQARGICHAAVAEIRERLGCEMKGEGRGRL